jgi:hypothetical protein
MKWLLLASLLLPSMVCADVKVIDFWDNTANLLKLSNVVVYVSGDPADAIDTDVENYEINNRLRALNINVLRTLKDKDVVSEFKNMTFLKDKYFMVNYAVKTSYESTDSIYLVTIDVKDSPEGHPFISMWQTSYYGVCQTSDVSDALKKGIDTCMDAFEDKYVRANTVFKKALAEAAKQNNSKQGDK